MRVVVLVFVVVAATAVGCGIGFAPTTRRIQTIIDVGTSAPVGGPVGPIRVDAVLRGRTMFVRASAQRTCTRHHFQMVQVYEHHKAELVVGRVEPIALLPFPLDLLVTTIVLTSREDRTWQERRPTGAYTYGCPVPVSRATVTLPSGASVELHANEHGNLIFDVAESEPDRGVLALSVDGGTAHLASYYRNDRDCSLLRDALFEQLRTAPTAQRVAMLRALPRCPGTSQRERDREWLWNRTIDAALEATTSRCGRVQRNAVAIANVDPTFYQAVFLREPDIAQCVAADARSAGAR